MNQTGLVNQWTSYTDPTLFSVPKNSGFVQLFGAPKGTALPHPLVTVGAGGETLNYSSLAGFLAANPGWAGAVNTSGAVPALIALGAGLFDGGTYTINNIAEPSTTSLRARRRTTSCSAGPGASPLLTWQSRPGVQD